LPSLAGRDFLDPTMARWEGHDSVLIESITTVFSDSTGDARFPVPDEEGSLMDMGWLSGQLAALGQIGSLAAGGISRPALSRLEAEARDYVRGLMLECGLSVRLDPACNLFGRLGRAGKPAILTGSHIDTVPQGGKYDGALGVLAALACAREIGSTDAYPLALEIVAFTGEESSRFGLSLFGSRAYTGALEPGRLPSYVDSSGIGIQDALAHLGASIEPLSRPTMMEKPAAFIELHIEQGTLLRDAGAPVGVVTAIAAPTRLHVWLEGRASHSGASLPADRRDALVGAALVIAEIETLMKREEPWQSVATVGRMRVVPNVINVIPGEVELGIDIRGSDPGSKRRLVREIDKLIARVSAKRGLFARRQAVVNEEPVRMDERVVSLVEQAACEAGIRHTRVVSMAGHDAMQLAQVVPTGMILVRNQSGISHSPAEHIDREDIEAGARTLLKSLLALLSLQSAL
jgi:N-carbamoyl-L-amino-acid hydrolase